MPNTIYRAVITALTISLLAIPVVASAADSNDQVDSHRIMFHNGLDENSGNSREREATASYAIYVEPEMNITDEMKFIEDNLPGEGHGYVIDVFFAAQPQGELDMTKPEGLTESEWIQFLEANVWDYDPTAKGAGEADVADFQGEGYVDPINRVLNPYEPSAEVAGEADLSQVAPGFCEVIGTGCVDGELSADIAGEADVEGIQDQRIVDRANRAFYPY